MAKSNFIQDSGPKDFHALPGYVQPSAVLYIFLQPLSVLHSIRPPVHPPMYNIHIKYLVCEYCVKVCCFNSPVCARLSSLSRLPLRGVGVVASSLAPHSLSQSQSSCRSQKPTSTPYSVQPSSSFTSTHIAPRTDNRSKSSRLVLLLLALPLPVVVPSV